MENDNVTLAKQIGYRIKLYRKKNLLTQKELAKILGIAESAIANYETGVSIPKDSIKPKLCEVLNVSLDTLFGTEFSDKFKKVEMADNTGGVMYWDKYLLSVPILGKISAGSTIFAEENITGYLPIDPRMYGIDNSNGIFFLKVVGESMNKLVQNGAYVLVKVQDYAEDGDVIVPIIDGEETTLKKFRKFDKDIIRLEPCSTYEEFQPITINLKETDFKIIGKVIGDFKKWN